MLRAFHKIELTKLLKQGGINIKLNGVGHFVGKLLFGVRNSKAHPLEVYLDIKGKFMLIRTDTPCIENRLVVTEK